MLCRDKKMDNISFCFEPGYLLYIENFIKTLENNMNYISEDSISDYIRYVSHDIVGQANIHCPEDYSYEIQISEQLSKLMLSLEYCYSNSYKKTVNRYKVKEYDKMLQNSFALIERHFAEDISYDRAAKASNLSTSHFCRLFKKVTGMTFGNYLTMYRVNQAEKMLASGKAITDISYACGFNSITTFWRAFRKYKNCTPSSMRKSMQI